MNACTRTCRRGALAVVVAAGGCGAPRVAGPAEQPFPIEQYARYRSETERRLSELTTDLAPRLRAESPEEQQRAMREIAAFTREHLGPHAQQVETLYAFADRQAGPRYTETMRYEHGVIGSRIRFLEVLAGAPEPDVPMFRTKVTALLNFMWGHMDTETNTIGALVVEHEMERRRRVASGGGPP